MKKMNGLAIFIGMLVYVAVLFILLRRENK